MVLLLVVLFVAVPLAEIALIIWVGSHLGAVETIGLLLLVSILGAWLVKRQGLGVVRRIRDQWERGVVPAVELLDGAMILVAGVLLLTPGFLTDAVGLLLLLAPMRAGVRGFVRRHLAGRVVVRNYTVRRPSAPPDPPVLP